MKPLFVFRGDPRGEFRGDVRGDVLSGLPVDKRWRLSAWPLLEVLRRPCGSSGRGD
jgi:hypothetical protein